MYEALTRKARAMAAAGCQHAFRHLLLGKGHAEQAILVPVPWEDDKGARALRPKALVADGPAKPSHGC